MTTGAITNYIDVAQLVLYAFWFFFAALIYYLHQEGKREGYPLESSRGGKVKIQGFPAMPEPKTYKLADGRSFSAPHNRDASAPAINASPTAGFPGAPLEPNGDPMLAEVGPGAYTMRSDVPDMTLEGTPRIVPLRSAGSGWGVAGHDPDPRGKKVLGADGEAGGTVVDLWVDRSEMLFRYIEIEARGGRRVLLPMNFARVTDRAVNVKSILGSQFDKVPGTRSPDQVTFLEEEKIMAYYGAGTLYATPARQEPLL